MEIYLGIEEYKDNNCPGGYLYYVSNLGNIKNYKNRVLKPYKNNNGYMGINLFKDGQRKHHYVHRLVLSTFKANSENKPEVNHKDENKENNTLNNLEWMTRKENANYGSRNEKASKAMKIKIKCIELNKVFDSAKDAAIFLNKKHGAGNISSCCSGKYKSAYGYTWKYAEGDVQ